MRVYRIGSLTYVAPVVQFLVYFYKIVNKILKGEKSDDVDLQ